MILVTGDIHGFCDSDEVARFSRHNKPFWDGLGVLTKDDYVIICGDFGLVWDGSEEEQYWLEWLRAKPFTTLFLDGNHENFDRLATFPVETWHGGLVQTVAPGILHLMRGQVYELDGRRLFVLGGAQSHDIEGRVPGKTWWPQELPTEDDFAAARRALDACGWTVDDVLTHSLPTSLQRVMYDDPDAYPGNRLTDFLDEVYARLTFQNWYSGHYHVDGRMRVDPRVRVIYHELRDPVRDGDAHKKVDGC
ncbi:MAG: metallophosphoesterase [Oscillospiraceae bacterium]|nr:metallophosphoesterase [Oscillospiraceae bacterium]